jgi:ribonuclease HI
VLISAGREKEIFGGESLTTNNRMELMAVIEALRALNQPCAVVLHLDSEYVRKGITEWIAGWKARGWRTASKQPVKNVDLWQMLDDVVHQSGHAIDWRWVKGHSGNPGNERADGAAKCALVVHGPLLADFSRILAQRGWLYIRFLRELAQLFVRVAREVQAALEQARQSEAPLHPNIFGRKRMLKPVPVELRRHALGDDGAAGDILFSLGQGPLWPSRWAQHEAFCGHLRDFWQSLLLRPRPRGQQGTAWMEAWIIFEMRHGGCPASHRPEAVAGHTSATTWLKASYTARPRATSET